MAKDEKPKAKGGDAPAEAAPAKKKLLVPIIGAVVVLGGAGGGYFYWTQQKAKHSAPAAVEAPVAKKLLFHTLEPAFVANFEGVQSYRFLQVQVQIATRSPELVELLSANDPIIRNDLLMLFSAQNAEFLATKAGKDKLRADALDLVRKAVKSVGGEPKAVESILFTSFVMQ